VADLDQNRRLEVGPWSLDVVAYAVAVLLRGEPGCRPTSGHRPEDASVGCSRDRRSSSTGTFLRGIRAPGRRRRISSSGKSWKLRMTRAATTSRANPLEAIVLLRQHLQESFRLTRHSHFPHDLARIIHNADARLLDRHIESSKIVHPALSL